MASAELDYGGKPEDLINERDPGTVQIPDHLL